MRLEQSSVFLNEQDLGDDADKDPATVDLDADGIYVSRGENLNTAPLAIGSTLLRTLVACSTARNPTSACITIDNVGVRVNRAKKQLKERLGHE